MERSITEVAVPAVSLVTALLAVTVWRRPVSRPAEAADVAPGSPRRGATWGHLQLRGTQLLGVLLDRGDLVLDLFGGTGMFRAYGPEGMVEEGKVAGTAMLTFRAGFDDGVDLRALERLEGWLEDDQLLDLDVEVDGASPLRPPLSIVLGRGQQKVSLLTQPG